MILGLVEGVAAAAVESHLRCGVWRLCCVERMEAGDDGGRRDESRKDRAQQRIGAVEDIAGVVSLKGNGLELQVRYF